VTLLLLCVVLFTHARACVVVDELSSLCMLCATLVVFVYVLLCLRM